MADDAAQIAPTLIPLVSVVVGGIIGIAGGLIGPLILERRKQEAEKKKRKAEKLEELVQLLNVHHTYIHALANKTEHVMHENMDMEELLTVMRQDNPFHTIDAIVHVHFQEFLPYTDIMWELTFRFFNMLLEDKEQDKGEIDAALLEARSKLKNAVRNYAKREFQ